MFPWRIANNYVYSNQPVREKFCSSYIGDHHTWLFGGASYTVIKFISSFKVLLKLSRLNTSIYLIEGKK